MSKILKIKDVFKEEFPIRMYKVSPKLPDREHAHEYMQIWYLVQGNCTHIVENVKHKLNTKNLLVIPPFVSHRFEGQTDDVIFIGCEFPLVLITEDKNNKSVLDFTYLEVFETAILRTRPCYVPSVQCQLQIEHTLENMLTEFNGKEKYYEICLKADLLKLLTCIARDYEVNYKNEKITESYKECIEASLSYIDENFSKKIYIEDAAKAASMSESYFSYFFKKVTGQTFVEYISKLRIKKAKEMLKHTSMSVSEIGYEVGFNDSAYFNRVFKKEESCTPTGYRKKLEKSTKNL